MSEGPCATRSAAGVRIPAGHISRRLPQRRVGGSHGDVLHLPGSENEATAQDLERDRIKGGHGDQSVTVVAGWEPGIT